MQTIAKTCVRFDAAHLSINFVLEITVTHVSYLTAYQRGYCVLGCLVAAYGEKLCMCLDLMQILFFPIQCQ